LATEEKIKVYTNSIRYSNDIDKAYDVCTFQIYAKNHLGKKTSDEEERVFIKINKMKNVKIFLYEGNLKYDPTKSMILDN